MRSSSRQHIEHVFSSYSNKRISKGSFDINQIIPTAPVSQTYSSQYSSYVSTSKRIISPELNGNTGIVVPQIFKKQNNTIILDRDLPSDLKRIDIDSRQFNQNQGYDSFACIIPINQQFGRKLNGMRLRYGEKLTLHSDKQGNLKKLKQNVQNQRIVNDLKSKLLNSQKVGTIQSFLYIVDDQTYNEQDNQTVDYQSLLLQKENKIVELQHIINASRKKLREMGHSESQIPKVVYSEEREMLYKMGQNLQSLIDKYPQQQKSIDSSVKLFMESQLNVDSLTRNILRYRESRFGQFSQILVMLGQSLGKIFREYPKLMDKVDGRVLTFINNEFMRTASNSTHRIIDIVQYVPQTVKVQNVYSYAQSKEESKRLTFHMRALIKVLLEQLERIKKVTGIALELDEAVFQMVKKEAGQVLNVQQLLRVFQSVPRTVEVQNIVEKVVTRFIELPQVRQVITQREYPVEMKVVEPFQRVVNNVVEVISPFQLRKELLKVVKDITQQVMAVPTRYDVPVELIRQIPKIEQITVERDRVIEREVVVPMPQKIIQKAVYNTKYQTLREQVPVKPDRIIEQVIKQVPVIVERVIDTRYEVMKTVPQTRIVEKEVYRIEKEVRNNITTQIQVHPQYIEKIVPVQNIIQVIKEVQRIVQKPFYINTTNEVVVEVEVIRQVPIYKKEIQIVEKQVMVPYIQQVLRQQKAIVENYNYVQIVKPVDRIVQIPVHQHTENIVHVPVNIQIPVILYKNQIIEIDRIINHEVIRQKPINIIEEKIVEIQQYFERIKQVKTIQQKIVQKIVQVPKVVEVEKIVEKIIIVPRVIDRIVKVDRIVEVPVQTIIQKVIIQEVERIIQKPVIQQRLIEVQRPFVVIQKQQIPIQVIRQILKTDLREYTKTQLKQLIKQKIVIQRHEIPRDRIVQKLIPLHQQVPKFIDKQIIIQVPVEKEVTLIQEKVVPLITQQEKPVQIVKIIQKIVPVREQITRLQQVQRMIQRIIRQEHIKIVEDRVPYPVQEIIQVPTQIPVQVIREVPKQIRTFQEKLVDRQVRVIQQVPITIQVQRPVIQQKIVELREIIPRIIQVPRIIEVINNQFRQIPILIQRLKQIELIRQIPVITRNTNQEVIAQQIQIQKAVIQERIKQVMDRVEVLKTVAERFQSKQTKEVPIIINKDRVIQVPMIVQQIVEKIILMPQVVQVLKYVHEILQTDSLTKVDGDIGQKQMSLRIIASNLQGHIGQLLGNLKNIKTDPKNIQMIEKFLIELRTFVAIPRIHQIIKEVETNEVHYKDRYVQLPTGQEDSLSKNLLIQNLIMQIKRLKRQNPALKLDLPDDILSIFFINDNDRQKELNQSLRKYAQSIESTFRSRGSWNREQQQFLNSFLIERFSILQQFKSLSKSSQNQKIQYLRKIDKLKKDNQQLIRWLKQLPNFINAGNEQQANLIINNFNEKYFNIVSNSIFDLANLSNSRRSTDNSDLMRQISRLRAVESEHKNCLRISEQQRLRSIEKQVIELRKAARDHQNCEKIIDSLQRQKERLQQQIQTVSQIRHKFVGSTAINSPVQGITSPRYQGSRNTQSDSDYGQNYMNYQYTADNNVGIADGQSQTRRINGNQMRASFQQSSTSRIESNRNMHSSYANEGRQGQANRRIITQSSYSRQYIPHGVGQSSVNQIQSQRHVYSTALSREGHERESVIGSSSGTGKYIKMSGYSQNAEQPKYQGQGSRTYYKREQN